MQIIVNPHTLELNKTVDVNSGEYNIQECEFVFSSEYEGLTKMAIFSNEENSFQTIITNETCIIPAEILQTEGTIGLGVYGYEVNGDNLVKRYSPKPVFFNVELGSYQLAQEAVDPSADIIAQILAQLETLSNDISTIQGQIEIINDTIPTLATKDEIPTKVSELENDSNYVTESQLPTKTSDLDNDSGFITQADVPSKTSQLENDSGFITKSVNDLENYTKTSDLSAVATSGAYSDLSGTPDLSVYATNTALGNEITARENADIGLQGQIDAITSSSDVKDIVGTYQDLLNYDTSTLGNDDIIKVLQDSTHNDAMTYYRWVITGGTGAWQYIGQEGPYYTKSEIDTTLQGYVEDSDLTDYVKNTDYASNSTGGVIKTNSQSYSTNINSSGELWASYDNYATYQNKGNYSFISKGTLEAVITGKQLVNQTYVDNIVGDINTALDLINGESI